ncbi:MAG: hypothetical protein HY718_03870, partial [Planctomycetes bacterium]|nr:hypothetical protein [Planctomycetota bacterium]
MRTRLLGVLGFLALWIGGGASAAIEQAPPEPGPENGGLRLRLVVETAFQAGQDAHHVRLDLLNVTDRAVTLTADWANERDKGDFKDYLESAVNIETYPQICHESAQTAAARRQSPQPQYVLKPKEALSIRWEVTGRKLKNNIVDPNRTLDPRFPVDGLYA